MNMPASLARFARIAAFRIRPELSRLTTISLRRSLLSVVSAICLVGGPSVSFANIPGGGTSGPDVTLVDGGATVTLDNGIVSAVVNKAGAKVTSLKYKGFEMVGQAGAPHTTIYFSMDGGASFSGPSNCIYTIKTNTADLVDISCKHIYATGDVHPVDMDLHFVLRRGNTGLYMYNVLSHPATYPAFSVGEYRMVWSTSLDPNDPNNFLLENIYIDELRHWQAPSEFDLSHSTATDIKEISLMTSGVRAGQFDCKYEYAVEYQKLGAYGFASNVNKIGGFLVLGNYEYFNDGPTKQDLASAEGTTLLHFGRDHFNGSGTNIPAGRKWSKVFGPYLVYCNANAAGADACWADAQAQAIAEHSAWPYSWLTGNPDYPLAAERGSVTGKFIVTDPLKPSQTGANAWVGVTDVPSGTNWQSWSGGYEYWVQAGPDGSFTIPNIRPGTYTFSAFVTGVVGEFTKNNVSVAASGVSALGNVSWNVTHPGLSIAWEIGVPDRSAEEFAQGKNYYVPYEYRELHSQFPNPINYTVGSSDPAKVWPYVQSALWQPGGGKVGWPWHIHFNLSNVPATGDATLTLALAGAHGATIQVFVNNDSAAFATVHPVVAGGNGLLREVVHSKYDLEYVTIPMSQLKNGANTITLLQASLSGDGNHVMYDYLNLEMPNAAVVSTPVIYQAEAGIFSVGSVVETANAGWTGLGYVNSNNAVGAFVEVAVNVPAAGIYKLDFRYANGTATDRQASVSVEGASQSAVSFLPTGAWTTWNDVVLTKALNAGTSKIRVTATTVNGCANLDKLTVLP